MNRYNIVNQLKEVYFKTEDKAIRNHIDNLILRVIYSPKPEIFKDEIKEVLNNGNRL